MFLDNDQHGPYIISMTDPAPTYRDLYEANQQLRATVAALHTQLKAALDRIAVLEAQLSEPPVDKHSANSSRPPSSDPPSQPPRRRSLRRRSGRRPGGQPGHTGHGLPMHPRPTSLHRHAPAYCSGCGRPVSPESLFEAGRYQEIDLPPITVTVTEHRYYRSHCLCGALTGQSAPGSGAHYGARILSLAAYLSTRQYLPYARIAELMQALFQLSVSPGTLVTAVRTLAESGRPAYEAIRRTLCHAPWVGSDETSLKVAGHRAWAWTWQSPTATFLGVSSSRGKPAVTTFFPDGFPESILVHDRWAAQLNTPARRHQLCLAHLLRDLQYCLDVDGSAVVYRLQQLFQKAIRLDQALSRASPHFSRAVDQVKRRLTALLKVPLAEHQRESRKLLRALETHQKKLFVFLEVPGVPATNNSSEQAVRNLKVKQKVSTHFRTWKGAEDFVVIRSLIETCLKRHLSVFHAFQVMGELCLLSH